MSATLELFLRSEQNALRLTRTCFRRFKDEKIVKEAELLTAKEARRLERDPSRRVLPPEWSDRQRALVTFLLRSFGPARTKIFCMETEPLTRPFYDLLREAGNAKGEPNWLQFMLGFEWCLHKSLRLEEQKKWFIWGGVPKNCHVTLSSRWDDVRLTVICIQASSKEGKPSGKVVPAEEYSSIIERLAVPGRSLKKLSPSGDRSPAPAAKSHGEVVAEGTPPAAVTSGGGPEPQQPRDRPASAGASSSNTSRKDAQESSALPPTSREWHMEKVGQFEWAEVWPCQMAFLDGGRLVALGGEGRSLEVRCFDGGQPVFQFSEKIESLIKRCAMTLESLNVPEELGGVFQDLVCKKFYSIPTTDRSARDSISRELKYKWIAASPEEKVVAALRQRFDGASHGGLLFGSLRFSIDVWDFSQSRIRYTSDVLHDRFEEKNRFLWTPSPQIRFSADGRLFACSLGARVNLFAANSGRVTLSLTPPKGVKGRVGGDPIEDIAFDPTGRFLAGLTEWGSLHLWRLKDRRPIGVAAGIGYRSGDLLFSTDGRKLVFVDRGQRLLSVRAFLVPDLRHLVEHKVEANDHVDLVSFLDGGTKVLLWKYRTSYLRRNKKRKSETIQRVYSLWVLDLETGQFHELLKLGRNRSPVAEHLVKPENLQVVTCRRTSEDSKTYLYECWRVGPRVLAKAGG